MIPSFRLGIIAAALKLPSGGPSDVLLHFEGGSPVNSGTATVSFTNFGSTLSTAWAKFGTQSLSPTSCLGISSTTLNVGTGDCQFDCWVRFNNTSGQQFIFDQRMPNGTCLYATNGNLNLYDGQTGTNVSWAGPNMVAGVDYHVAFSRISGTVRLFVNGVLGATTSVPYTWTNTLWIIGAAQYYPIGVNQLLGYIDEVRILSGRAEYAASFTPLSSAYTA